MICGRPMRFRDYLNTRKKTARLLILGDYSESPAYKGSKHICLNTLRHLHTHLQEKGFTEAHLVMDFIDEEPSMDELKDLHFLKKSEYYIRHWAEILLFILLSEGDNQSVIREWSYMVTACPYKCKNAAILIHEDVKVRSLIRGDIRGHRIAYKEFVDMDSLLKSAYTLCHDKLYNLV